MQTHTADHYQTTNQAIEDTIRRSISHTEVVRLECLEEATFDAVEHSLLDRCEGSAETEDYLDFWGVNGEGEEWRVFLKKREA